MLGQTHREKVAVQSEARVGWLCGRHGYRDGNGGGFLLVGVLLGLVLACLVLVFTILLFLLLFLLLLLLQPLLLFLPLFLNLLDLLGTRPHLLRRARTNAIARLPQRRREPRISQMAWTGVEKVDRVRSREDRGGRLVAYIACFGRASCLY
jgi:hypothetical protein